MSIPRVFLILPALLVAVQVSGVARAANLPEIGAHQPVLIVEKNVNPQNKMVVFTRLDARGRFQTDRTNGNRPVLDFYWLMDGRNYKAVNPLIKKEIRKRFAGQWKGSEAVSFTVQMQDLKEVNSDIEDPKMEICARETEGVTNVEAQMNLGPSDGYKRIRLAAIYTEGRAFPPAVESVTLKGEELIDGQLTGRKIVRKYLAAGRSR